MMRRPRPENLGISRTAGIYLSIAGAMISLTAIAIAALIFGMTDRSTPVILSVLGTIGLMAPALVSALKATEAADTASRAHNAINFTASQNAMLQQLMTAHVAQLCPRDDCPLKGTGGTGP
jgi:hypothetical protein